jgi:hypothetical protein
VLTPEHNRSLQKKRKNRNLKQDQMGAVEILGRGLVVNKSWMVISSSGGIYVPGNQERTEGGY